MIEGLKGFFIRDGKSKTEKPESEKGSGLSKDTDEKSERSDVDILSALLEGKEIYEKIDTRHGEFEFRYPNGADQIKIARRRAEYLGGFPDESFDPVRRVLFEQWATLDVLISKAPEKFSKIKSWADCPDPDLVDSLYDRGARFCKEIRSKIRGPDGGRADSGGEHQNS